MRRSASVNVHLYASLGLPSLGPLATSFLVPTDSGPFANAKGDIVAGDVEGLAVVGDTAQEDMGVRVAGVVVIDRDPVELRSEVGFHLLHQRAGGLARVGQFRPVLGRDDEAELMTVIAAPVKEGMSILCIALGRIDLALRAILRHAVPLQVTQVRVHCHGADKLPSAGGSTRSDPSGSAPSQRPCPAH